MGDVVPPRVPFLRNSGIEITIEAMKPFAPPPTDELTNMSDQLLNALHRLRAADRGLRDQTISSEEFHRLADEVDVLRDELSALRA